MLNQLLIKHKSSGVLLDTNLLILYLIGTYDPVFVPKFKRTIMYSIEDFEYLKNYIHQFSKIIVTPQILAESWNFLEKINEKKFKEFIKSIIPTLYLIEEEYIEKNNIIADNSLHYIGITDVSVILAAKNLGCLVLTDDLRSYSYFLKNKIAVININHLR